MFNGHGRRQTGNQIDIRPLQLLGKLARIRRHGIEEPPLSLGKKDVKSQRAFTRSAQSGDDDKLIPRNLQRNVFQVMFAGAVDGDGMTLRSGRRSGGGSRPFILAQHRVRRREGGEKPAGVTAGTGRNPLRRALGHQQTTVRARFWTEINHPVSILDHIQIVLDDHEAVPGVDKSMKYSEQQGNIIEMQTGCRFIEDEQRRGHRR